MSFQEMVDFLDSAWVAKNTIVPCLIGPVGIGKTAAVKQHAKNVGAGKVVTIIASQILPNEVSGITMPESETKSMQIYDHYRLSSLEDGDILFFDELLEADQYVLSACLTLIESRMMMSGKLLPDIQIIAAANPTVAPEAIRVNIRQRFMFRSFKIDKDDTAKYIQDKFGFKPPMAVLNCLTDDDNKFNVLSPRSLTKICEWLVKSDNITKTAEIINECWQSMIATHLTAAIEKSRNSSREEETVRNQLIQVLDDMHIEFYENEPIAELFSRLQKSDRWKEIAEELAKIDITSLLGD